jgi:hypothetical protein
VCPPPHKVSTEKKKDIYRVHRVQRLLLLYIFHLISKKTNEFGDVTWRYNKGETLSPRLYRSILFYMCVCVWSRGLNVKGLFPYRYIRGAFYIVWTPGYMLRHFHFSFLSIDFLNPWGKWFVPGLNNCPSLFIFHITNLILLYYR